MDSEKVALVRELDRLRFAHELAAAFLEAPGDELHLSGYHGGRRLEKVAGLNPSQRGRLAAMVLERGQERP